MNINLFQSTNLLRSKSRNTLFIAPFELLLIAAVIGLFITVFKAATKSIKGPKSLTALKTYLSSLSVRLNNNVQLDAELERANMEKAINATKTSCLNTTISSSKELKVLLDNICHRIETKMNGQQVDIRSAWQQLKDTAFGFQDQYFRKAVA